MVFSLLRKTVLAGKITVMCNMQTKGLHHGPALFEIIDIVLVDIRCKKQALRLQLQYLLHCLADFLIRGIHRFLPGPCAMYPVQNRFLHRPRILTALLHQVLHNKEPYHRPARPPHEPNRCLHPARYCIRCSCIDVSLSYPPAPSGIQIILLFCRISQKPIPDLRRSQRRCHSMLFPRNIGSENSLPVSIPGLCPCTYFAFSQR